MDWVFPASSSAKGTAGGLEPWGADNVASMIVRFWLMVAGCGCGLWLSGCVVSALCVLAVDC